MDLTLLAQALQQAEKESAQSNPYALPQTVVDSISWSPQQFSTTENVAGGAIKGLLSGLFGGWGENYQNEQNKQIYSALPGILDGNLTKPDDMDMSVFAPLEKAGNLFSLGNKLEAKQTAAKEKSDYENEVKKALLNRGKIITDAGEPMSIFSPLKDKEEEARVAARGKLLGENDVWGGDAADNPESPKNKKAKADKDASLEIDKRITDSRDYLNRAGANYVTARDNMKLLVDNYGVSDPAADIVYAIAANKILDPTSVVREGEVDNINQVTPGLSKYIKGFEKYITPTGVISPEGKKMLISAVAPKFQEMGQNYKKLSETEKERLKILGGDPALLAAPEYQDFDLKSILTPQQSGAITPEAARAELARRRGAK